MNIKFAEVLHAGTRMLFDGGMGTQLDERGIPPTPATNLSAPDAVLKIQRAYREAGADVLITNTFGANPLALARSGDASNLSEYVAAACRLAREALGDRGGGGFIAGDIGPSGEFLEPYGSVAPERMRKAYEQIARALADNGADLLLVETVTDLSEMHLAVEACKSVAPDLPLAVTMAFDPAPDGFRTNMGVAPADLASAMDQAGVEVVGANCGSISPEQMAELVRALRRATSLPILAQSNAGKPELKAGKVVYPLAPEPFAEAYRGILQAGAQLVGGCCGTGPDHIRALRRLMDGKF